MPLDDVLDDFEWENHKEDLEDDFEEELEEEYDLVIPPDADVVCIMRFPFSWQAELVKLILRKNNIASFITNDLTNNMMQLEWAQVNLFVIAEEAARALEVLEENRKTKGEFPE
ncbi:MAG: DUF2007 domain-containing protein [Haliscomenobacter sp.]|uniref:putative signal transducing protein n=1 Tax=Haliscomenobacter sp. TaxID=2717303 RepID=UPI0029B05A5B|nr:DUF2007 domain-containing protein [Haliscomenobacter sp.]MDX2067845.1 DUF2007 domain-containing protein [Haliscomenobacter sp.]